MSEFYRLYPGRYARERPDRVALVMGGSGQTITYRQLNARSNRLAHLLQSAGIRPGDHIAVLLENHPNFLEVCWVALRSGLYFTPVNSHLTPDEAAYIVADCGARTLISSSANREAATRCAELHPKLPLRLMMDGAARGFDSYEDRIEGFPGSEVAEEREGAGMLYSSGTTGRPKGVKPPLSGLPPGGVTTFDPVIQEFWKMGGDSVFLLPGPLYHAAPLFFALKTQGFGGTVVCMERFDAAEALSLIERHRVTHSQWVPTMFVRMMRLPARTRHAFDLSTHAVAIHGAAPCPVPLKERMIEWWGPIISEFYAGTERNGMTLIDSEDWLRHKGSVGRPVVGAVTILDDAGGRVEFGDIGTIYFSGGDAFEYHNDPDRTAAARSAGGRTTLGDVGHVDEDGYLYLTDRKDFLIISGGVNIYPQEVEDLLIMHGKVMDVAVVGVPNDDFGEEVKAVVQPIGGVDAGPDLERELIAYCRQNLAAFKCPRSIDFDAGLPRLPSGKLYKRLVRDRYWPDRRSGIV